ncbi:phospholipase D-like domain-containing protein [Nocardioides terrisoli]|uniref:phospholipase D-like domain-containing protein n=1 Tax=Nocardioides terrisoli TaxID=3388267 RepID=UPI00287B7BAB|nr:phospholipase D-like domain-containing protein [Nocardioides marmorisolisilvae]
MKLLRIVRRTLLAVLGLQLAFAIGLTLVDSYRRRGKKPKPFPTRPAKTVPVGTGTVTTYTFGQDLYEDMLAAIEGASKQVLLETYIWKGDEIGERFKRAVSDAAARGVDVHVIYDSFANLVVSPRFKRFPAGVKVLAYPVYAAGWRFFDLRRYGRDHRKILVVDDEVAFAGGYNIGSPYATEWRDTHCRITGPAVLDVKRAFADFWNLNRTKRFQMPRRRVQPLLTQTTTTWEPQIRVHRNVPRLWMFPIRTMYIEAINKAERNVWLTHAYFIPDENFIEALTSAAARGVDVRIVLPAKSNHIVADWISRGYFTVMLEAGIRIFRFHDAMVHAKTATIDGSWSTIGTANVDRLSMTGNYEINIEVIDNGLAAEMEKIFETDQSNCSELHMDEWRMRDIYRRFTEMFLNPLRHVL